MNEGISIDIYGHIWEKSKSDNMHIQISIPDTIIYRYNQPIQWYFTSKTGHIMRKANDKFNNDTIIRNFLKKPNKSKIIAYFIYSSERKNLLSENDTSHLNGIEPIDTKCGPKVIFEYFDRSTFIDFVSNRVKTYDGILQRFTESYGVHHSVIIIISCIQD